MWMLHFIHGKMNNMHDRLRRIDLNLLLVFDALRRHRSVVAAAGELAMSPSAVSHALARLREAMSDELFVRYGNAMQPTARAEQMTEAVAHALHALNSCLDGVREFDPATSQQGFVFAATDFTAFALLPSLVEALEKCAPHLRIQIVYSAHRDSLEEMAAGRVHFAIGMRNGLAAEQDGVECLHCFDDDYVVAASQQHPAIGQTLSLDQYLAARHVVVTPWVDAASVVNTALERQGLKRDVAVQLPSLLAAPFVVARSSYLITLPRRLARAMGDTLPLAIYPAPFPIPPYALEVCFHRRHAGTPGHAWLRDQILAVLDTLKEQG